MKTRLTVLAAGIVAAAGSIACADITYTAAPNAPIADVTNNQYSLSVNPGDGVIASMDRVFILGSHTWVGDLTITLTHVDTGTSVTLIDRPGFGGNGDNLDGSYGWVADGPAFPDDGSGNGFVAQGNYLALGSLGVFAGEDTAGTWRLNIDDQAFLDSGRLQSWGFTVTPQVPTPGAAALAGLGVLCAARRRRQA